MSPHSTRSTLTHPPAGRLRPVGMYAAIRRTPSGAEAIDPGTVSAFEAGARRLAQQVDEAMPMQAQTSPVVRVARVMIVPVAA